MCQLWIVLYLAQTIYCIVDLLMAKYWWGWFYSDICWGQYSRKNFDGSLLSINPSIFLLSIFSSFTNLWLCAIWYLSKCTAEAGNYKQSNRHQQSYAVILTSFLHTCTLHPCTSSLVKNSKKLISGLPAHYVSTYLHMLEMDHLGKAKAKTASSHAHFWWTITMNSWNSIKLN